MTKLETELTREASIGKASACLHSKMKRWVTGQTFFHQLVRRLGVLGAWAYIRTARPYRLKAREVGSRLWCRPETSDRASFCQVFIEEQYASLPFQGHERLIIDCGANVGYASAYFLSRCPQAHVVAVEPELDNYRILVRNLLSYGDRVTTIQAAVWPKPANLRMVSGMSYWASQVEETSDGDAGIVAAVDISSLLAPFPGQRVDILKVDIEGAEVQLFSEKTEEWINRVDVCAAELHGTDGERAFHRLFTKELFNCFVRGELTIAVRRR